MNNQIVVYVISGLQWCAIEICVSGSQFMCTVLQCASDDCNVSCLHGALLLWRSAGRRVPVPAVQLQCCGHTSGLGADAPWETHTLPRRTAPCEWDKIHHGLLY